IGPGCEVSMHFRISLRDGEEVESSFDEPKPFLFTIGDGMLGAGLEAAIFGLHAGDKQDLEIEAGIAFGVHDSENIHAMSVQDFSTQEMNIEPGMVVEFTVPNGEPVLGTICELDGDHVDVDFNHPLAGRAINFEVEIFSVKLTKDSQQPKNEF
ncbi:MAG: peptidylprolyl isomerase, partial [Thiohalomonadales bacterium]